MVSFSFDNRAKVSLIMLVAGFLLSRDMQTAFILAATNYGASWLLK